MKKRRRTIGLGLLIFLMVLTIGLPVYADKKKDAEETQEKNILEEMENVEEQDSEGLHIAAGSSKKRYLPFEKIQLILQIVNKGYPEIRDIKAEMKAPAGFDLKVQGKEKGKRDSLGLGEVMTIQYEGYNTTAIILFLGVGAGVIVLLIFFFLLFRFMKNRRKRRQITACIVLMTMLAQPSVTFAAELSEYSIADSIAEGVELEQSIWEDSEASMTQKLSVGLSKPEVSYQISFKQDVRLNLSVKKSDKGDITLAWNEIEGLETYEVYRRTGDGAYSFADSTDDNEYSYKGISEGSVETFQVVGYREDASKAISSNECRYIVQDGDEFVDSDGDNIQDFLEEQFGTSLYLADTDGDGLLDSTEIYQTFTNPVKADSNGDAIHDGMEDIDGDGLSNLREQEIGTSFNNADTDGDGLLEGEEWPDSSEMPLSDPLSPDSDADGLDDKMEKELGTDPWKTDSNDDGIADGEDTYAKDYQIAGCDSVINIKAPAEVLSNARMLDYTYSSILSDKDYVVSEVTCMQIDEEFEEASVTMKIQDDKVPDGDFENVSMFYYNEEINGFEKMEGQSYDAENHTITAPTTHFSTFILVYVPNWHAQFEAAAVPERGEDGNITYADVSFVIDESNSMEDSSKGEPNDPERYRVQAAKNFTDALIEGDRAAVVGFTEEARRKCELLGDMNEVKSHIDSVVGNGGGTAMHAGLREALNELVAKKDETRTQFMIVLSDGEDSSPEEGAYDEIMQTAAQQGIAIYTIALGSGADLSILSQLAMYTGGDFFRLENAEDLPKVYSRIANNAVMGADTDKDGLADKVEEYGIRDGQGVVYKTDPEDDDTDDDEIRDGEEAGGFYSGEEEEFYIVLTNPTEEDTDGDGLWDLAEIEAGTLPWCRDTDGDGLTDYEEWVAGFNPLNTNGDNDAFGDYAEYYDSARDFAQFVNLDGVTDTEDWSYKFCQLIYNMLDRDPFAYDLCDAEICCSILAAIVIGDFGTNLAEAGFIDANYVNNIYYLAGGIIGGLIPGLDEISNIRDMIADFIQGDLTGAALNAVGALPAFGEVSDVVADMTKALSKTMDDLPNLQRMVLWLSSAFRSSAEFFFTQDMFLEAGKKTIKNGFKNIFKNKGIHMAQLTEDFIKYADEAEVIFTKKLLGLSDSAVHITEELTGNPQQLASAARKAFDNQIGGKVVEEVVDGTTQKVYKKVSVLDLDADTYKNPANLKSTLKKRVEAVKGYGGSQNVDMTGVTVRQLDVVVPNTLMPEDISETLLSAQSEAADYGVKINYQVYTADGAGGTFFDDMQKVNKNMTPKTAEIPDKVVTTQQKIDDLAKKCSRKPANVKGDPDEVMLGRHLEKKNADGTCVYDSKGNIELMDNSYEKLAQDRGAWYYQMDESEWNELLNKNGEDYMWEINKSFLRQMNEQGKKFLLSIDPSTAEGSYYLREIDFLKNELKCKNIVEIWEE